MKCKVSVLQPGKEYQQMKTSCASLKGQSQLEWLAISFLSYSPITPPPPLSSPPLPLLLSHLISPHPFSYFVISFTKPASHRREPPFKAIIVTGDGGTLR